MSSDVDVNPYQNVRISVIRSQNYGSIQQSVSTGTLGAFAASPPSNAVPPAQAAHHNEHLSNLATLQRAASDPLLPQSATKPSRLRRLISATSAVAHSPYLRTYSPRLSPRHKPSFSTEASASGYFTKTEGEKSSKQMSFPDISMLELKAAEGTKVSAWGAGFSIINVFLGLGLLSFPYALAEGSFTSLAVLAFICFAMSYTGKLIVRCFSGVPWAERTYHAVGFRALNETFSCCGKKVKAGNFGKGLVTFGILLEFIGGTCMSIIFIWDNVSYLAPDLQEHWIAIMSTLIIMPTCCMLNVSELAINAFLGCICKVFTVSVIIITFFLDTTVMEREQYDVVPKSATHFSVSIGIFILSYAGHACLPEIYTSMKEPRKFESVLDVCFVIMFFTYSGMALFGYLQYGEATAVIITQNLIQNEHSTVQIYVAKTLIGLVIASCYFQVSPLVSVAAAIPEDLMGLDAPWKRRLFRCTFLVAVCVASWVIMKHLAILEAATGSLCTMITAVICPALFYYGLNRKSVSLSETALLITYIVCGVLIGVFLLYYDIMAVVQGQQ